MKNNGFIFVHIWAQIKYPIVQITNFNWIDVDLMENMLVIHQHWN